MTISGAYLMSAILSAPVLFTNMLPIEIDIRTPVVAFEQLSYCTTLDEAVVAACVGLYANKLVLSDGRLLQPIKFPASQYVFVRDEASSRVIVYQ